MILHISNVVVTIGFERRLYSVQESLMTVEVAVVVYDGVLARAVEVNIMSIDRSAMSKLH